MKRNIESDITLLDCVYALVEYEWGSIEAEQVKELFDFIKDLLRRWFNETQKAFKSYWFASSH